MSRQVNLLVGVGVQPGAWCGCVECDTREHAYSGDFGFHSGCDFMISQLMISPLIFHRLFQSCAYEISPVSDPSGKPALIVARPINAYIARDCIYYKGSKECARNRKCTRKKRMGRSANVSLAKA